MKPSPYLPCFELWAGYGWGSLEPVCGNAGEVYFRPPSLGTQAYLNTPPIQRAQIRQSLAIDEEYNGLGVAYGQLVGSAAKSTI